MTGGTVLHLEEFLLSKKINWGQVGPRIIDSVFALMANNRIYKQCKLSTQLAFTNSW